MRELASDEIACGERIQIFEVIEDYDTGRVEGETSLSGVQKTRIDAIRTDLYHAGRAGERSSSDSECQTYQIALSCL